LKLNFKCYGFQLHLNLATADASLGSIELWAYQFDVLN